MHQPEPLFVGYDPFYVTAILGPMQPNTRPCACAHIHIDKHLHAGPT